MKTTKFFSSLLLLSLSTLSIYAGNSNARPPMSMPTGIRLPWLKRTARVQPAAQDKSQKPFSENSLSNDAAKDIVLSNVDLRHIILEYLTYKDYAQLNALSHPWRSTMAKELTDKTSQLILPIGIDLVAYVHKLFDTPAPANDPARLSILNHLLTLGRRSYVPGDTFVEAFKFYDQVPDAEKVCLFDAPCLMPGASVRALGTLIDDIRRRERENASHDEEKDAEIENEAAQEDSFSVEDWESDDSTNFLPFNEETVRAIMPSIPITQLTQFLRQVEPRQGREQSTTEALIRKRENAIELLRPLLKRWQPYGVLMAMANIFGPEDPTQEIRIISFLHGVSAVNLFEAPQISANEPIIDPEKGSFKRNDAFLECACVPDSQHTANLIQRLHFLHAMKNSPLGSYEPPASRVADMTKFHHAVQCQLISTVRDARNFLNRNPQVREKTKKRRTLECRNALLQLDQITNGEYAIGEIVNPTSTWDERQFNGYTPTDLLMDILRETVRNQPIAGSLRAIQQNRMPSHMSTPARLCYRMAMASYNPIIKERYLKKALFFWDNCLQDGNLPHRASVIDEALQTYRMATHYISNQEERAAYARKAFKIKAQAQRHKVKNKLLCRPQAD